jgi:putative transposase
MSIRKINFVEGEYYHIYNRGNGKQKIFHDNQDYRHFIDLLYILNTKQNLNLFHLGRSSTFDVYNIDITDKLVSVGAYCIMPNHFHILITQISENGISKFMQKLSTAYVMYYNKKYKRTGSLFEGKFKSEHVSDDIYLKYLYSYIHLNPIKLINNKWKEEGIEDKNEAIKYLNQYKYSSYLDYFGVDRVQNKILNTDNFPKYFKTKDNFKKEIFEWLSYNSKMH